ncbi:LytR/AlgR family response regulator transcription factor [Mucilaginibacter ginsenosidivorans]|uniref:Response regulator transcription factor n=1 Tax=Mucilaginibacter ginsenosidivorans TaxID=398053 RepID=A0A5B8UYB6_9SPHI|nr:LytTR family DNA-binding domain-containing protein [Mucilaginibacter ginsenosidivorans]QEC64197.1 response regulator transcription factor [Mucilaginibacter ginsenosidivorans]
MKLNCVIIDDEYLAIEVLKVYCAQVETLSVEQTFKKPGEALEWLQKNKTDILFLDIEMPKLNGFEVLAGLERPPIVILTTAYQHFAVKAFDLEMLDYLVKPIEFERFEKAVNRAAEYIALRKEGEEEENDGHLLIKSDYKLSKVPFNSIQYIEGLGEYVKIYTPDKTFITLAAIKDLEQSLPEKGFVRIHKSYIVAIKSIISYSKTEVKITGNIKLPVGRVFKNSFIEALK